MQRIYATSRAQPRRSVLPKPRLGWYVLVALGLGMLALGLHGYARQLAHGDVVTGMRDPGRGGAAWGLYISLYVYLVGISFAGITVASIARLFKLHVLEPVTRVAELLTIASLIAGATAVLSDLGRPGHGLVSLPDLARPSSPFYGTFTLVVAGYLFSSVVAFFVTGRRDAARMVHDGPRALRWFYRLWASGYRFTPAEHVRHGRTTFWLAITILPLLVVAHSTLGFIFGIQAGRPGWYSALMAPSFIVLAGASGMGMLILAVVVLRRMLGLRIPDASIHWLGSLLWILCLVYLYFTVVEELTATYAGPALDRHVAHTIVTGQFSRSFTVAVGCLALGSRSSSTCVRSRRSPGSRSLPPWSTSARWSSASSSWCRRRPTERTSPSRRATTRHRGPSGRCWPGFRASCSSWSSCSRGSSRWSTVSNPSSSGTRRWHPIRSASSSASAGP
jgi:Ni/Fe-hydrogenase subunit HybB-like protein